MAIIEAEHGLTLDTADNIDIFDFTKLISDLLRGCLNSDEMDLELEAVTSQEGFDFKPNGYGIAVSKKGLGFNYIIELTGKSPLESVKYVIDELPKAIESITDFEIGETVNEGERLLKSKVSYQA